MGRKSLLGAGLVAAVVAMACGDRAPGWDEPLDVVGPVEAAGQLVWLNRGARLLVAIDPASGEAPVHVQVGELPRMVAPASGGAYVLGGRGDHPTLDLVSLPGGEVTSRDLDGAYDRIAVSPDRRFAVLFYDPTLPPAPGGPAARNNNEISVVDFAAGKVTLLALRTESIAPKGIVFAPTGTLAAVVLDSALSLLDLSDPGRNVKIPLKLPGGSVLTPEEALFSPDAGYLYVRTRQADDVLSIEIGNVGSDLTGFINFLFVPGASGLTDIAIPTAPSGSPGQFDRYVAALYRGSSTGLSALLDATGDESRTHLAQLSRTATHLDDLGNGNLLIYGDPAAAGSTLPTAAYVAGWDPIGDRLEEDLLQAAATSPPRIGAGVAYFSHEEVQLLGRGSTAALTAVTLETDGARMKVNLTPIALEGKPTATALDPTGLRLYLGVDIPRKDSGAAPDYDDPEEFSGQTGSLAVISLAAAGQTGSLVIDGLPLDERIEQVGLVGSYLFAIHGSPLGDVTLIPQNDLSRDKAVRYDGFLASGLLDRPEEN